MTLSRFVLYFAGLLLLCLLAAGIYCYQHLPSILAQQAKDYLQEYGVQDLRFTQFEFSGNRVSTDELWLRGERDGLRFEATVASVDIGYNWRMLLNGELHSLSLANLAVALEQIAPGTESTPTSVSVESLLPQPLMAQLPVRSVEIKQWQVDYRSAGAAPITAAGNLRWQEQLSLHLEATHLGSFIAVDARSTENQPALSAQLWLSDGENSVAEIQAELERASSGEWQWNLLGEWDYAPLLLWLGRIGQDPELALDMSALEGINLLGQSRFTARIRHPDTLVVSSVEKQTMLEQFSADISLVNNIAQLDYLTIFEDVAGKLDVSVELDAGQLELTVAPTELNGKLQADYLSLPQDTLHWLNWQQTVPIRWQSPEPATIATTPEGAWSVQLRNAHLLVGSKDSELRWEALNLDSLIHAENRLQLNTEVSTSLKTRLRRHQLPQMELAFNHEGSLEDSQLRLSVDDTAESLSLELLGTANLTTGNGRYKLSVRSLDLPYAAGTLLPLMEKFGVLEDSVEVSGGKIAFNSDLKSGSFEIDTLQQQSHLLIQNLSGSYGEYQFEGMGLDAGWSGIERWKTLRTVEFSLAKLNVGFDLVDMQARLSLPEPTPITQPVVTLEQFSAGMFGGRVYLPEPKQWDFGGETNSLTLRAERWQLEDVVALQKGQDIEAVGLLEGELPVTLKAGRIIVEKGYLRALAPGGSIRYVASPESQALAASSPELGLAMDLLSDFQYEVLSSDVELDEEGNLLLGLSLAGRNPKQYEGRLINFNINLEQNLDPLLQSLRLSDKLVEKLEGRLQ